MPTDATKKLFARVTFPPVAEGVRRKLEVKRNEQLVHDFDVGSEQLETLIPVVTSDDVELCLRTLKDGQWVGNPLTASFKVTLAAFQQVSATQFGYKVEEGDIETMRPAIRKPVSKTTAVTTDMTPSPTAQATAHQEAASQIGGMPPKSIQPARPPREGEVAMSGLPLPTKLGPSQPAPPPTQPPAPTPHKNQ